MNAVAEIPSRVRSIELKVRECMARRNIRSAAELHRRLIAIGVEISHPQLIRVIDNAAKHLSVSLLNGLLEVLDCSVVDMIGEA